MRNLFVAHFRREASSSDDSTFICDNERHIESLYNVRLFLEHYWVECDQMHSLLHVNALPIRWIFMQHSVICVESKARTYICNHQHNFSSSNPRMKRFFRITKLMNFNHILRSCCLQRDTSDCNLACVAEKSFIKSYVIAMLYSFWLTGAVVIEHWKKKKQKY